MRTAEQIKADMEVKEKELMDKRIEIENVADAISKLQLELWNLELGPKLKEELDRRKFANSQED